MSQEGLICNGHSVDYPNQVTGSLGFCGRISWGSRPVQDVDLLLCLLTLNPLSPILMGWKRGFGASGGIAASWLKLSVHFDAFRAAPFPYLTTWWWWLVRKRVRARNQLAPLLGMSPRAYELWLLRDGASPPEDASPKVAIFLLALIDVRVGSADVESTLRSLAANNVPAIIFGTRELPTLADVVRAIDWDRNPWLMPMAAGDTIAPGTRDVYASAASGGDSRLIYADDDLLGDDGRCSAPHFKPDWNKELFRHFDYLSNACIARPAREGLKVLVDVDDWVPRLVGQLAETSEPRHVHRVLHHRRQRPCPNIPVAPLARSTPLPPVTVIVPTRNRLDLLETCLRGVGATDYPDVEVIVVDNESDDPATLAFLAGLDPRRMRVLRCEGPFNFSALNNRAVAQAEGHLLCLLNNDIEVIEPNWLATMAIQALRDDVGAVGARLLYPDGRIQHAGVVIGIGQAAGHAHRFLGPDEEGYFHRHALPQFTSAVTAACLVVSRERFLSVGGLDEENFAVAYNDVDLCLRLNKRGWQSLYEPRATLIHHESVSRGLDRDPVGAARLAGELAALKRLWGTGEAVDPFHHPDLSRAGETFVMRLWD